METDRQVLALLEQKRELFGQYEEETEKMHAEVPEEVEHILEALEKREELAEKIDEIDGRIRELCDQSPYGNIIWSAVRNRCGLNELPEEYRDIFLEGQKIFQVVTRIQDLEKNIRIRLKEMQADTQKKLRQNQQVKKFSGYLEHQTYDSSVKSGFLYDKKR